MIVYIGLGPSARHHCPNTDSTSTTKANSSQSNSPMQVDYTKIGFTRWDDMSAADYMKMVTHPGFLGDPTIKTQHLLGQTWWEKVSETEVIGHHQLRAAHQVYSDADLVEVKLRGHSHATNEHYYRKVGGVWKFAGLKPNVRWNEMRFEEVFKGFDGDF